MGLCEDDPSCDKTYNAVMPLSRASTRERYSRIVGVTATHHPHEVIIDFDRFTIIRPWLTNEKPSTVTSISVSSWYRGIPPLYIPLQLH